ncbi:hypothetical protein KBI23_13895 [bacterium]|nr:hypothetical protein [bacterium]
MNAQNCKTTSVGQIDPAKKKLTISVSNAGLRIRHEERGDISVETNNPENWQIDVTAGTVVQTKATTKSTIVQHVEITAAGGKTRTVTSSATVENGDPSVGGNIFIGHGNIIVNGKNVTVQKSSSTDDRKRPEQLERLVILLPNSHQGDLELNFDGPQTAQIDSWDGGKVKLALGGSGHLLTGPLSALLSLDLMQGSNSSGNVEIESVMVETLNINCAGRGELSIMAGTATSGSFSSTGSGDTIMRGQFGDIVKNITGSGMVSIKPGKN